MKTSGLRSTSTLTCWRQEKASSGSAEFMCVMIGARSRVKTCIEPQFEVVRAVMLDDSPHVLHGHFARSLRAQC